MNNTVLLDTNILIYREDNKIFDKKLQKLLNTINNPDYHLLIHSLSLEEIKGYKNEERKKIILSKINSYQKINNYYNFDLNNEFKEIINPKENNTHDFIDNSLLFAVFNDDVSFLITEDKEIHKKASKLNKLKENFSERVFTISDALNYFKVDLPVMPYSIKYTTVNELDIIDPIFDKLKADYPRFDSWFTRIQKRRRKCLVYKINETIGALLIYKEEEEIIELYDQDNLPSKRRMKIATMIVTSTGYKIGEFFLSWILKYSLDKNLEEIYLTHFIEDDDALVYLIEEYGFINIGNKYKDEAVFVKVIDKNMVENKINKLISTESALDLAKKFYPYFYDGEKVNKYIVPTRPEFHKKLFLQKKRTNDSF
jgi:rRNA-processing protein FCF1